MGHEKLIISELSTGQTTTEIQKNVQSLRLAGEKNTLTIKCEFGC
jgi:hypothetical protein